MKEKESQFEDIPISKKMRVLMLQGCFVTIAIMSLIAFAGLILIVITGIEGAIERHNSYIIPGVILFALGMALLILNGVYISILKSGIKFNKAFIIFSYVVGSLGNFILLHAMINMEKINKSHEDQKEDKKFQENSSPVPPADKTSKKAVQEAEITNKKG